MSNEEQPDTTRGPSKAPGGDITAGKGQREEARSNIYPVDVPFPEDEVVDVLTPGDINTGHTAKRRQQEAIVPVNEEPPGVERSESIKGAERLPRKGDEIDEIADIPTD
jgi:hypothetical protein